MFKLQTEILLWFCVSVTMVTLESFVKHELIRAPTTRANMAYALTPIRTSTASAMKVILVCFVTWISTRAAKIHVKMVRAQRLIPQDFNATVLRVSKAKLVMQL